MYSQYSDAKHEGDAYLLLPVELQRSKLRQWKGKHPYVESYAGRSVRPNESVDAQAASLGLAVPAQPVMTDGFALENDHEIIYDDEGSGHDYRSPDEASYNGSGKEAQVKGQYRELDSKDLCEVQYFVHVHDLHCQ